MKEHKNFEEKNYPLPPDLVASELLQDERVILAKKLLQEAVASKKQKLTSIRPPQAAHKVSYDQMLKTFAQQRGGPLFHPYVGSGFGNGCLVELADGSVKYDMICGIGVHYFGHNHPDLLDSSIDAALSNTIMQGHLQQNVDALQLTELLLKASGFDHCFLTSSGAMANENALKIAFQKKFPAGRILAFEGCFAGRTITFSQITDRPKFREGLPHTVSVDYIPFYDPNHPEKSTEYAVEILRKTLKRYPNQHAVMIFELIQGEEGFRVGEARFFETIMTILKEHSITIFADEVQSFGRTHELFAYQYFGLQKYVDIASIGKLSQVCATLYTDEFKPRPGLLSQTFLSSTSAIKASYRIISSLLNEGYFGPHGKIAKIHHYFAQKLSALAEKYPDLIHGPWGVGCMVSFTPYDGDEQKAIKFLRRLFDNGVITYYAGGAGSPARVRFLIPIGVITHRDIDQVIDIVEKTLIENKE